jgi:hypothetical protein
MENDMTIVGCCWACCLLMKTCPFAMQILSHHIALTVLKLLKADYCSDDRPSFNDGIWERATIGSVSSENSLTSDMTSFGMMTIQIRFLRGFSSFVSINSCLHAAQLAQVAQVLRVFQTVFLVILISQQVYSC